MSLTLIVNPAPLAIVRLAAGAELPSWAAGSRWLSVTRTPDETSIVCDEEGVPESITAERGYRAFRVAGTLPFEAVGVLVWLASPLAAARIPIFVISTHDTDYILVPGDRFARAVEAIREAGHSVTE